MIKDIVEKVTDMHKQVENTNREMEITKVSNGNSKNENHSIRYK